VIWKRFENSLWIRATEMGSPTSRPFFRSNRMIAIILPTFSRVRSRMIRPPAPSSDTDTAGRWFWSKVGAASVMRSPVSTT